jgi:hypothetical protein
VEGLNIVQIAHSYAPWKISNVAENLPFADVAILRGRRLPQTHRLHKLKSLLMKSVLYGVLA